LPEGPDGWLQFVTTYRLYFTHHLTFILPILFTIVCGCGLSAISNKEFDDDDDSMLNEHSTMELCHTIGYILATAAFLVM